MSEPLLCIAPATCTCPNCGLLPELLSCCPDCAAALGLPRWSGREGDEVRGNERGDEVRSNEVRGEEARRRGGEEGVNIPHEEARRRGGEEARRRISFPRKLTATAQSSTNTEHGKLAIGPDWSVPFRRRSGRAGGRRPSSARTISSCSDSAACRGAGRCQSWDTYAPKHTPPHTTITCQSAVGRSPSARGGVDGDRRLASSGADHYMY